MEEPNDVPPAILQKLGKPESPPSEREHARRGRAFVKERLPGVELKAGSETPELSKLSAVEHTAHRRSTSFASLTGMSRRKRI